MKRGKIYALLSSALGREYHTAELRDMKEVALVIQAAQNIKEKA